MELLFPGIEHRVLGASAMFQIPGCRELCLWMNATNAEKYVAENVCKSTVSKHDNNHSGKLSLVVYPGGSKGMPFHTIEPIVIQLHDTDIINILSYTNRNIYH